MELLRWLAELGLEESGGVGAPISENCGAESVVRPSRVSASGALESRGCSTTPPYMSRVLGGDRASGWS